MSFITIETASLLGSPSKNYFIGSAACTQKQTKDRANLCQSSKKKHPTSKAKQLNLFRKG